MKSVSLLALATFLVSALAGCAGSGGSDGIKISAPKNPGDPWVFEATVSADEYHWDLGDQLTVAEGKKVEHVYDLQNAVLTVVLETHKGETTEKYSKEITLGTGLNERGSFIMETSTDWAVVGETFTMSAAKSTDPDGDAIRLTWRCDGPKAIKRVAFHDDGFPPNTVGKPKAGSVVAGVANETLPAATLPLTGDMCEALNAAPFPSTAASTVSGAFEKPGLYTLFLIASDGAHATASGSMILYVTAPAERPPRVMHQEFSGTISLPSPAPSVNLQQTCAQLQLPSDCDRQRHPFDVAVALLGGWVNVTVTAGPQDGGGAPAAQSVRWELYNGDNLIVQGGPGETFFPGKPTTKDGAYALWVIADGGANVAYAATVDGTHDMDPKKLYELA